MGYKLLGPVSRKSRELFGPEKLAVKLQSACFEKLIFLHVFNVRKKQEDCEVEGLEPWRYEDIKYIVAPEIDPKSFGTFEKQAPGAGVFFAFSSTYLCSFVVVWTLYNVAQIIPQACSVHCFVRSGK